MATPCGARVCRRVFSANFARLREGIRTEMVRRCSDLSPRMTYTLQGNDSPDEEFRLLVIPGHTELPGTKRRTWRSGKMVPPPRYKSMPVDQDWTSVWPAAHTFKWSAVPIPVRQGYIRRTENDGIPPGKYGNAELMKIPNFLHLTPVHIKKHCQALKELCTPWPEGLETNEACRKHFPVTITTQDYLKDGWTLRDPRARTVTLQIKLSSLELDAHSRDKLLRLAGPRYNEKTDILTIPTDRCPLKKQNYEYALYLLTALYHESWKYEPWEEEKAEADMERYVWEITHSKKAVTETVSLQKQWQSDDVPSHVTQLSDTPTEEEISELPVVQNYKAAITELHDMGEDIYTLNKYKEAAVDLLIGKQSSVR